MAAYNTREDRVRNYSTRCKNKTPGFNVPTEFINKNAFISDLVKASLSRDVTRCDNAILQIAQGPRKKRIYADAVNSIRALHAIMSNFCNLATFQIEISLRNASDLAGLTTISEEEQRKAAADPLYVPKVCISRASRAFQLMIELGWIVARKEWQVWDKDAGCWTDKYYEATPLFFEAAGISPERAERQKSMRIGFLKQVALKNGKSAEEVGRMSETQIKAERKLAWHQKSMSRRKGLQEKKKIERQLRDKTRTEQRQVAQQNVLGALSAEMIQGMTSEGFKILVNKEIARLRRLADLAPPIH